MDAEKAIAIKAIREVIEKEKEQAKAIYEALGGKSKAAIFFGKHKSQITRWARTGIPLESLLRHAARLEKAGVISRKELFPRTWHEIWPEIESNQSNEGENGD